MEKQELNTRNSLVVASHQWLLGELAHVLELVGGVRRKLCECVPSLSGTEELDVAAAEPDRDVDAGLQQIEHLLSVLVRLHPDDFTNVDLYGCDNSHHHDRLASAASRILRNNRSLDLQLCQAIRENRDLQLNVELLESDTRRLKDHNIALQDELSHLRDNVRAELSEFLPDSGSMDMKSIVEAVGELKNRAERLQTINNMLQTKVVQLEDTSANKSVELQTNVRQLEAERETLLKRKNELQRTLELSQRVSQTTSPVINDSACLKSKNDELETQLCLYQDTCAAMTLSLQEEQKLSRRTEEEKNQLICKIEELQLETKKIENGFDITRKQLEDDSKTLRSQNDELMRKIYELEIATTTDISPTNSHFVIQENARLKDEIEALNESIFRKSELILEMDEKLRRCQQQKRGHSHSTSGGGSGTPGILLEEDGDAEEVADIYTRLQDQNASLEKAKEMRDILCRDLDQAKMDNNRLLGVVGELRAQLDNKDSDVQRLRASITDLQERLTSERHDFCEAVELVRRENAAECDKIAQENHHLTTLLQELELSYTDKVKSLNKSF